MQIRMKHIFSLFLIFVLMLPTVVLGATEQKYINNPVITISKPPSRDAGNNSGEICKFCENANKVLWGNHYFDYGNRGTGQDEPFLIYKYDSRGDLCNIEINMMQFNALKTIKQKNEVMTLVMGELESSHISELNKTKIFSELNALTDTVTQNMGQIKDTFNLDYARAARWFKPFQGPIGIILGLLCILIFVLLTLTLLLDVAFISLPMAQSIGIKPDGSRRCFVSSEAYNAIKEQASKEGHEYVNPLSIYMRHKVVQIFILSFCIVYIFSDKIFDVVAWFIDLFFRLMQ